MGRLKIECKAAPHVTSVQTDKQVQPCVSGQTGHKLCFSALKSMDYSGGSLFDPPGKMHDLNPAQVPIPRNEEAEFPETLPDSFTVRGDTARLAWPE